MAHLKLYIGTSEEDWQDYIYLDLITSDGTEFSLDSSEEDLDSISGDEFLTEMERICNAASLFQKELKLKLEINRDEILEAAQEHEFHAGILRNINLLIQEMKGVDNVFSTKER